MRSSSSTSTTTSQPLLPFLRMASTPSTRRPVSAATCSTARRATSIVLAAPLLVAISIRLQAFEQLVLEALEVLRRQLAAVEGDLQPRQLGPHLRGLVERLCGLVLDLLGDPHHAAHRRQRQRQQSGDQTHVPASAASAMSTK